MKRSLVGIICSTAVIAALAIAVSALVGSTCTQMYAQIDRIQTAAENGDWAQVNSLLAETNAFWHTRREPWAAAIDHEEVEKIDVLLVRLAQMGATRNLPNFLPELQELRFVLQHIQLRLMPLWSNIL